METNRLVTRKQKQKDFAWILQVDKYGNSRWNELNSCLPVPTLEKVTIIQGDPGEGKDHDGASDHCTKIDPEEKKILPGKTENRENSGAEMVVDSDLKLSESPMEPVDVIYQTAEDGLEDHTINEASGSWCRLFQSDGH